MTVTALGPRSASVKPTGRSERILWTLTLLLVLIAVVVAIRRILHLIAPSPPLANVSENAALDVGFGRHPVLTLVHVIPGLLFMILGPLQFVTRLRNRRPTLHRWSGRVFIAAGFIIGATALVMSPLMPIGGANETAATVVFAIFFLFALVKGFLAIRGRNFSLHREWMIRAFAIGLAVATIRPIVGTFFATRALTHLTPQDFFGIAFWLGFTLHLMAAEMWINYTRGPQ